MSCLKVTLAHNTVLRRHPAIPPYGNLPRCRPLLVRHGECMACSVSASRHTTLCWHTRDCLLFLMNEKVRVSTTVNKHRPVESSRRTTSGTLPARVAFSAPLRIVVYSCSSLLVTTNCTKECLNFIGLPIGKDALQLEVG